MKDFEIKSIGLMSGTSLDGLDVCQCTFKRENGKWSFTLDCACGYQYPEEMKYKLGIGAQNMSALDYVAFHTEYGFFLGEKVRDFIEEYHLNPDIISSHGHTIFHMPEKKIMCQIGDGAAIAAVARVPVVSDFRRLDIMLGGQGAPLVPIGDRMLFGKYDFCLNIGGFSNISFEKNGKRIAFDISPVNYVINHYCRQIGLEFDRDGEIARRGVIHQPLLDALNDMDFYKQEGPKSLGREWVETYVYPLLENYGLPLENVLRTFYEHAAMQVAHVIENNVPRTIFPTLLITGGGAFNKFLVERIKALSGAEIVIPDKSIIEYKEALIFAFLGALYMADEPSCLSSVTGADIDNIGGHLFKI